MDGESRVGPGMDGHALGERMFGERVLKERDFELYDDGSLCGA